MSSNSPPAATTPLTPHSHSHTHALSLSSFPVYLSPSFKPQASPTAASRRQQLPRSSPRAAARTLHHAAASESTAISSSSPSISSSSVSLVESIQALAPDHQIFDANTYATCSDREQLLEMAAQRQRWIQRHRTQQQQQQQQQQSSSGEQPLGVRVRTMAGVLIACLNLGVVPPDAAQRLAQPHLTSVLCWHDAASPLALKEIGSRLQSQYERWQPRAKWKQVLDPIQAEMRRALIAARRAAKNDRVLVHLNGHGVPRPTSGGEIWCFNAEFTQYLPVPVSEMLTWVDQPSVFVVDCSGAGHVLDAIERWMCKRGQQNRPPNTALRDRNVSASTCSTSILDHLSSHSHLQSHSSSSLSLSPSPSSCDVIVMAACAAHESLPHDPSLPGDLFTACLTTPLTAALRFCAQHSPLLALDPAHLDLIPGTAADRKTPLGELHWTLTSITDSIAFSCVDRATFARLFRADLLVASLFRHFLLAERVMRAYRVSPCSLPKLPVTHTHALWLSWDAVAESYLLQLDKFIKHGTSFVAQPFFSDQLTAFELALNATLPQTRCSPFAVAPVQLPIVLQVLLSPSHRRRALALLAKFLVKGPHCVPLALEVGIQPYVLKLLEGASAEIRDLLALIWAHIVFVDPSQCSQLIKANGHRFFAECLTAPTTQSLTSKHPRMVCMFVLACCASQGASLQAQLYESEGNAIFDGLCRALDEEPPHAPLRQWALLCMARLSRGYALAQGHALTVVQPRLLSLLRDPSAHVRIALLHLLAACVDTTPPDLESEHESSPACPSPCAAQTQKPSSNMCTSSPELLSIVPCSTPPLSATFASTMSSRESDLLSFAFSSLCLSTDVSGAVREELALALSLLIDAQLPHFRAVADTDSQSLSASASTSLQPVSEDAAPPPLSLSLSASQQQQQHQQPSPLLSPTSASSMRRPLRGSASGSPARVVKEHHANASHHTSLLLAHQPHATQLHLPSQSYTQTSASLPLSRAFTEPPASFASSHISTANSSPPTLSLASSGMRFDSFASLASFGESPQGSDTSPEHQDGSLDLSAVEASHARERRSAIWRCVRTLCQDPISTVATAAAVILRKVTFVVSDRDTFTQLQSQAPTAPPFALGDGVLIEALPVRRIVSAVTGLLHAHLEQPSPVLSASTSVSASSSPAISATQPPVAFHAHSSSSNSMLTLLTTSLTSVAFERASFAFLEPVLEARALPSSTAVSPFGASTHALMDAMNVRHQQRRHARAHLHAGTQHTRLELSATLPSSTNDGLTCMALHPYEPLLAACDSKRSIHVWDCARAVRLSNFSNDNRPGQRMCQMAWLNPLHVSLLAVADEGATIRIWRSPHESRPTLLNAFTAHRERRLLSRAGPFLMEWIQRYAWMLTAGTGELLSVWDLEREIPVLDLPLDDVRSLATHVSEPLAFAGGIDGVLRSFDFREARANTLLHHSSPIVKVAAGAAYQLTVASRDGEVLCLDSRMMSRRESKQDGERQSGARHHAFQEQPNSIVQHSHPPLQLIAFAAHTQCSLFAGLSHTRFLRVYNGAGTTLMSSSRGHHVFHAPPQTPQPQPPSHNPSPWRGSIAEPRKNSSPANVSNRPTTTANHGDDVLTFHPLEPMLLVGSQTSGDISVFSAR